MTRDSFALSVTSKLGYPSHVLNGAIGRTFARTKDERLLLEYEQDYVDTVVKALNDIGVETPL